MTYPGRLEVITDHTLDVSLLDTDGCEGWVLEAGCRDFTFARRLAKKGLYVCALDPDPGVEMPEGAERIVFLNVALATYAGEGALVMTKDPQARYLAGPRGAPASLLSVTVRTVTVPMLLEKMRIQRFEAVKLDIEGTEYEILLGWPGPVSKQISVEFHEHVRPRPPELYDEIFAHLGQWYEVVQHEKTTRHFCAPNYWDSLFVLKEALR